MSKRIIGLVAVVLLVFSAPAALPQQEQQQSVYTFVSMFQVPRADWPKFAEGEEKNINPILERLVADGTIVGWSNFETIVHSSDGMTHGIAWSSPSLAGIMHVLDEIRKAGTGPATGATKHEDLLMRSIYYHMGNESKGVAYLRVNCTLTQPGKAEDFVGTIKKYLGPTFDDQLKKGNLSFYGMDQQFVWIQPGSMRCSVFDFPSAEALNGFSTAVNTRIDGMNGQELKAFQQAIGGSVVADTRRDILARITHSGSK